VKIAPRYAESVVHVNDASRAVGVVSSLLDADRRRTLDAANREQQERLRFIHEAKRERPLLSLDAARANRLALELDPADFSAPAFLGARELTDVPVEALVPYIDWTFFFAAWELKGKFPAILDHPERGPAARELYENGRALLDRIIREHLLTPRAVYGFWPAGSSGDDLVLFADASRTREQVRFPMLRQQGQQPDGKPNLCLSDFVAPIESGISDHVGAFAVTSGVETDDLARTFEKDLDDYNAIMVKALADRLAEAFAEYLHARVRREWGYGADEGLSSEDLIAERYRGIRPAFGYPACPDHTRKGPLFSLLGAPAVGIELTESYAMRPAASVSGLYLAHPKARYFTVGRIDRDQVADYAARTGLSRSEAERWLAPNLGYEPEA
jgi:5-methyltetrahydrofolate--homocysteine methyltransferase